MSGLRICGPPTKYTEKVEKMLKDNRDKKKSLIIINKPVHDKNEKRK